MKSSITFLHITWICFLLSTSLSAQGLNPVSEIKNGKPSAHLPEIAQSLPDGYSLGRAQLMIDENGLAHYRIPVLLHGHQIKGVDFLLHERTDGQSRIVSPTMELKPVEWSGVETTQEERISLIPTIIGTPDWELETSKWIWMPENLDWRNTNRLVLTERIDLHTKNQHQHLRLYINVENAELLLLEDRVCTFDPGTAVTRYSGIRTIQTEQQDNGGYILLDKTRGNGIRTVHSQLGDFYDFNNYWDNENEANDDVATDVHWGMGETYDWFLERFNRNSYDNTGVAQEAFMIDNFANAYYIRGGTAVYFGEGSDSPFSVGLFDNPFTSLDVVGHEVGHGMTHFTSGLIYSGESGGLNEAFSDIVGISIQANSVPEQLDWRLGNDFSSNGDYFRDMADPKSLGMPSTYGGEFWESGLPVHRGSSMANLWYYLLVEGGSGINDLGYNYNVPAIGMDKASAIAYHAWTYYFSAGTDYPSAAGLTMVATIELYGCGAELAAVEEAWAAIGLPIEEPSGSASRYEICNLADVVDFSLSGEIQSVEWNFGDGTTTTEISPSHTYSAAGQYTVTASGQTCAGSFSFSLPFDIRVLTSDLDCSVVSIEQAVQNDITQCSGSMFVIGEGETSNFLRGTFFIDVPDIDGYELSLTGIGNSAMSVSVAAEVAGSLVQVQNLSPIPDEEITVEVPYSRIRIRVFDFDSPAGTGIELGWSCLEASVAPTADFIFSSGEECTRTISPFDASTGLPNSWTWRANGEIVSTDQNPVIFLPEVNTFYDISLTVCNDIGCDEMVLEDLYYLDGESDRCTDVVMADVSSSAACAGRLRDVNQDDPYFEFNTRFDIILNPGFAVELNFSVFDLQEDDKLLISSGTYSSSSAQAFAYEYTGAELQNTSIQFPTNHLVISLEMGFEENNVENQGFDLTWQCIAPAVPTASFNIVVDAPCNDRILLESTSASVVDEFAWYLDGQLSGVGQNAVLDQLTPGTYDISLVVCTDLGCDTAVVENFVLDPPSDPQCIVNINDLQDLGATISLFPNPTRGSLSLSSQQQLDNYRLNLYDAQGREIREIAVARLVPGQNLAISVDDLASGIYWLRGIDESGTTFFAKRIVRW
ncbi:MAG: M4 family metallopeptidase [Bacteroidota bacterium]